MLLVPDNRLEAARQNVEDRGILGRIAVESIETFVSQNLSELSEFGHRELLNTLAELLRLYNRRVDEVESDKSLLIQVPRILSQKERTDA